MYYSMCIRRFSSLGNTIYSSKSTLTLCNRHLKVLHGEGLRQFFVKNCAQKNGIFQTQIFSKGSRIHLKSIPRNQKLNISGKSTRTGSDGFNVLLKWTLGLSGVSGYAAWTFSQLKTAHCKSKHHQGSRLISEDNSQQTDAKFDWELFLKLLWPDIIYLFAAIVCAMAAAIINIKIPLLLGEVVNVVADFTRDTARNFIQEVQKPALKLITYYGFQGLLTFSYISLLSTVGENLSMRMRTCLFDSILRQDVEFFDRHKTGELVDRLTSDVQDFKSSFKLCISQGLRASTQTIGCVGTLFMISPKLTGIMVTIIPAIVGVGTFMGSGLRSLSKASQAQVSKATAVADEAIGNVRTVRAFAMESKEKELYLQEIEKAKKLNIRLGVGIGLFQGLANVALNGIVLGTMFAGGWLMSTHSISAGDLMSFLVASQTIERSLAQMSLLFGNVVRGLSAGARVFEFIKSEPTIPLTGGRRIPYYTLEGRIEFQHVDFAYPTRSEQMVLKDFNLTVDRGNVVALVGLSGGGKSTVAALLERFYDIQQGEITIDGVSLKELDPTWLRGRAIGFINQEPVLFATSILENIRYGRPSASDQEVYEAAVLANADEFIRQFPEGYNTVLGERGVTVSGGQKQRIAIARALIKNPSILVLDEATSALDAESERVVQEALNNVIRGRTVLIIAHRLSTVRDANMIAVVSNGQIVEKGTHNELKKKKGLYWELIKQQELEEEIEEYQRSHFTGFH